MVTLEKSSTIRASLSAGLRVFCIGFQIFSRSGINMHTTTVFHRLYQSCRQLGRVLDLQLQPGSRKGTQLGRESAKVDGVLVCGDETARAASALETQQAINIVLRITMMVGKRDGIRKVHSELPKRGKELVRARDSAERDHARHRSHEGNVSAGMPHDLHLRGLRRVRRKDHRISATQRGERFTKASQRKQRSAQVFGLEQHDIKIGVELAVLNAVIGKVQLARKFFFRQPPRFIAVSTDNDRDLKFARDQKRLIAKALRLAIGINHEDLSGTAPVSAGQNIEENAALFQQTTQRDHKRRLTAAAHGNISYTDNGTRQFSDRKELSVVEPVSDRHSSAEHCRKRIHRAAVSFGRKGRSASRVRAVAPVCWRNNSLARFPSDSRRAGSPSNWSSSGASVSWVTTVSPLPSSNIRTISRKLLVCGPVMTATPCCAGSRILCPPTGTRLPPTNATSATAYIDASSPPLSSRKTEPANASRADPLLRRTRGSFLAATRPATSS